MLTVNNKFDLDQIVYITYDHFTVSKGYIYSMTIYCEDNNPSITYCVMINNKAIDHKETNIYATMEEAFK